MTTTAIRAEGIGKRFRIGEQQLYRTAREALARMFLAPFLRSRNGHESDGKRPTNIFWALTDVSFQVNHGEAVGILGPNGAGKSTLLKILSRITEPTVGSVEIDGRLSSLLEVGTGFHAELTGRENIYLNGAILGMRRAEISRKFDEIVSFAEVDRFIDTPVKHYSTGMYLRLAFAVAAHLETEILLVDEVLAVGDARFQKKCLGKMGEVTRAGRTVLFVSHNMSAMETLCNRALWLAEGRIVEDGPVNRVISNYLRTATGTQTDRFWPEISLAPGNEFFRLRRAAVRPATGSPADPITVQTPVHLEFEYWNLEPDTYLNLSVHVVNDMGVTVFNTGPVREPVWQGRPFPRGLFRSICRIPGDLLNDGTHRIILLVVRNQRHVVFRQDDLLVFEVSDAGRTDWFGKWPGVVRPDLAWTTELVTSEEPVTVSTEEQSAP